MATERIMIEIDAEAAQSYRTATKQEQAKVQALLSLWLRDMQRKDARRRLSKVMDEIGQEAQQRGLTPEILQSILDEE